MAASQRAFLVGLYEEYIEEASFLYTQRSTLFQNAELTWKKIGDFEERLEAHIDGLVVGEQLALEVCKRRAIEGDFGELFAATCAFSRQNRQDLVLAVFDQIDPTDAEKVGAVADALKYELPVAWFQDFLMLLESGDPKLAPLLARVFGYRRMACGPQLLTAMRRCAASALPELVWAAGRISYGPATDLLLDYLKSEDVPVRSAAAIALARMGDHRAIDYCLDQVQSNSWPILPLSLAGGRRTQVLLTELAAKDAGSECLIALGLLGDPASVPLLILGLEQPDVAPAGANALLAITGAALLETVFIPDEIDEDELFESEREQWKQGKPLDRGDGRPFGSKVTRISQKPEDWSRWWQTNKSRFTPGVRYRNGGPCSVGGLIDALAAEDTPHQLRWCYAEELVTRYAKDFGLEMDMPVTRQKVLLAEAIGWSESSGTRHRDGVWYFAGLPND